MTGKGTAASHLADDFQFCLVAFEYVFDNGQPEARAPVSREWLASTR
jgi:hypothetical protein